MFSITTSWLHETSDKPLEVFDNPQNGWTGIKWSPGNGHEYSVVFVNFPDIVEERLGFPSREVLVSLQGSGRVYSAFVAPDGEHSESSLKRKFGVQGHRLVALAAILHMAMPMLDKSVGEAKWKKLTQSDKKTVH